jgi:hypothetical protein
VVQIERDSGDEQVGGIGAGGEALVGAAKRIVVGAPERGVRVEAHADLVRDDNEGAWITVAQTQRPIDLRRRVLLDGGFGEIRVRQGRR